jgi:hypothetical protein
VSIEMTESVTTEATASLTPAEAAALLAATSTILQAELTAMPTALVRFRPGPEEWCALEVLGHLIETEERGFAGRIRAILVGERPQFRGWDPSEVARQRRDAERDPTELLAEFMDRRAASVALVEGLVLEDYARGGDHPEVGFLTIGDLLHEWVHHDANHLRQLLENVQAYAWPQMGNAQRFSAPQEQAP